MRLAALDGIGIALPAKCLWCSLPQQVEQPVNAPERPVPGFANYESMVGCSVSVRSVRYVRCAWRAGAVGAENTYSTW